ncbi:hypothetical protein AX15_003275 [Amanita polypyramis BW_CC]|nr:hypothetical protein AX15_003275 [Amanita polypyramis BW_CC]
MRFSAQRSASPSPERGRLMGRSSYGLYLESESESDDNEIVDDELLESDLESVEGSESSDTYLRLSNLRITHLEQKPSRQLRTDAEMRYIEDTVAAIRLRTRHQDPYEEWEQQTRKDAFRTARKSLTESQVRRHDELEKARDADLERLSTLHAQQMAEVQSHLNALKQQHQKEEQRLRESWKARDQKLWQRIESVIEAEEEKVKKRVEEERKRKLEEEEKRRLEEEKRRVEEEKRRREEEEARRKKEEEKREEERERARLERQKAEQEQRQRLGVLTIEEEWHFARGKLHRLKNDVMKRIKENKQMKKEWGELRRQITPKIGQLTNDPQSISRISIQLIQICKPRDAPPRNAVLYHAVLSSLAKTILMQAETEVTAEVRTAEPLAKVTINMIENLESFSIIFFARIVQRVGGWAIPIAVPPTDIDGRRWKDDAERLKVMGYRKGATGEETETTAEYCSRISGIMRVYFHLLKIRPLKGPLPGMFQSPRYWAWFARMLGEQHRILLQTPASAYLIHTALDVMGSHAKDIWGIQWIKMLALIYEGVTKGFSTGSGGENLLIGGQSSEGRSSRMRVLLEVERIMKSIRTTVANERPTFFS